jgi:hypothetical protein
MREIDASQFIKIVETQGTACVSDIELTGCALVPVTKVLCGPREIAISRDQWLVVVTVVV